MRGCFGAKCSACSSSGPAVPSHYVGRWLRNVPAYEATTCCCSSLRGRLRGRCEPTTCCRSNLRRRIRGRCKPTTRRLSSLTLRRSCGLIGSVLCAVLGTLCFLRRLPLRCRHSVIRLCGRSNNPLGCHALRASAIPSLQSTALHRTGSPCSLVGRLTNRSLLLTSHARNLVVTNICKALAKVVVHHLSGRLWAVSGRKWCRGFSLRRRRRLCRSRSLHRVLRLALLCCALGCPVSRSFRLVTRACFFLCFARKSSRLIRPLKGG